MILTQRQLDVLNHVVEDGQAWANNAKKEEHVLAKVAKYEAGYDAEVLAGGYRDRAKKEMDANKPMRAMQATDSSCPRWFEDYVTENSVALAPGKSKESYDAKFHLGVTNHYDNKS
jgi:hypothetical protein